MFSQFSTSTVARLTDTSERQMDYWARTGLLRPSGKEAAGKGSRRRYNFQDIVAAQTIAALRQAECPLQKIQTAVRYLRAHYPDRPSSQVLARLTLLTDGKTVYLLSDRQQVMDVVTQQMVWSVPLGKLIQEAQAKVDALPRQWVETVHVGGRMWHLQVNQDPEVGEYTVQCRELPGAIEQGATAAEAIANGKDAIASVLDYLSKSGRTTAGARHVQFG